MPSKSEVNIEQLHQRLTLHSGTDRVKASYGDNYSRLQKVKAKYDPENSFQVNKKPQIS